MESRSQEFQNNAYLKRGEGVSFRGRYVSLMIFYVWQFWLPILVASPLVSWGCRAMRSTRRWIHGWMLSWGRKSYALESRQNFVLAHEWRMPMPGTITYIPHPFFPGILESMIFVAKNFPVSLLGYVWPFSFRCRAFQDISIHREIVAMRNLSDFIEADEVVRMWNLTFFLM